MDVARATGAESRGDAPRAPVSLVGGSRAVTVAGAGAVVLAAFLRFGITGQGAVAAFFAGILVILAAYDLEHRIVPNRIVLPAAAVVLAGQALVFPDRALEFLLAALGAALFLLLPLLVYPAGMGLGDVKLALLLGAGLGSSIVSALVVGLFAGFIFAVAILAIRGSAARKTAIPFVPFLAFGALVALFFG